MKAVRIIAATILAPCFAVLPYLAFAYYALTHFAADDGAPAQGVLASTEFVLIGAILAMVFLTVARFSWKKKSMVVRQHLFGWPIGIAALFLLLLIVPASLQGLSTFLIVVATSGVCCAAGVDLLRIYERRVTHLSKIETDHAKIVAVDAKFLCDSLRDLRGRACAVWLVEREPHFTYSFFETVDEHRVFGVIKSVDDPHFVYWLWEWASDGSFAGATKTVDDRKISDAERITLWGEKKNA